MYRILKVLALFCCVFVQPVQANRRTCFCSWKIGRQTSDAVPNRVYRGFLLLCGFARRRCPDDCHNNALSYLRHPDTTTAGKDKVCDLYGETSEGPAVYSGSVASNCQGYPRYREIVPAGKICCHRRCASCHLVYKKDNRKTRLDIPIPSPNVRASYDCSARLTTLCEADCREAVQSSEFGSDHVNSASGERVCRAIGTKITSPGVQIKISYDINDGHTHYNTIPGGNVCCGCTCRASYSYQGQNHVISTSLPQPHRTGYFSCATHASQCQARCRDIVRGSLSTEPAVRPEDTMPYRVCRLHGNSAPIQPGLEVYSEYDIGNGYVTDKIDDFCCFKLPFSQPPQVFGYDC